MVKNRQRKETAERNISFTFYFKISSSESNSVYLVYCVCYPCRRLPWRGRLWRSSNESSVIELNCSLIGILTNWCYVVCLSLWEIVLPFGKLQMRTLKWMRTILDLKYHTQSSTVSRTVLDTAISVAILFHSTMMCFCLERRVCGGISGATRNLQSLAQSRHFRGVHHNHLRRRSHRKLLLCCWLRLLCWFNINMSSQAAFLLAVTGLSSFLALRDFRTARIRIFHAPALRKVGTISWCNALMQFMLRSESVLHRLMRWRSSCAFELSIFYILMKTHLKPWTWTSGHRWLASRLLREGVSSQAFRTGSSESLVDYIEESTWIAEGKPCPFRIKPVWLDTSSAVKNVTSKRCAPILFSFALFQYFITHSLATSIFSASWYEMQHRQ